MNQFSHFLFGELKILVNALALVTVVHDGKTKSHQKQNTSEIV